jgi:spore germination protein YaaH
VEGEQARKSFFAHPDSIDIFAPQSYHTDAEGELAGTVKSDLLNFAKKNNIQVMPLLTNGAFSQSQGHSFLDNGRAQKKLIKKLIREAKDFGYVGWQIDFEQMTVDYRDDFSRFIEQMYSEFKKNNLQLSVAVIAQVSERHEDYPRNLWSRIIGVYDYTRLASSTDFISIMSYDDPNSLGPVAGWAWYNKVLNFSLSKIWRFFIISL